MAKRKWPTLKAGVSEYGAALGLPELLHRDARLGSRLRCRSVVHPVR